MKKLFRLLFDILMFILVGLVFSFSLFYITSGEPGSQNRGLSSEIQDVFSNTSTFFDKPAPMVLAWFTLLFGAISLVLLFFSIIFFFRKSYKFRWVLFSFFFSIISIGMGIYPLIKEIGYIGGFDKIITSDFWTKTDSSNSIIGLFKHAFGM